MKIPLSNPDITELEIKSVLEVLNTPYLSLGPKLDEFEKKFASFIGSKHAVAVNSGTSGLHLCVKALGIKDGDFVLTTPFSFISSANCVLFERAQPVFVDIDERTLNIDVNKLEDKIKELKAHDSGLKALLPVHIFGRPCEMDEIMELANKNGLAVIEDACEVLGAEYLSGQKKIWRKVGTFGNCGVFAFYPNKQITTGEGGMIVTNDVDVYMTCRSLRNQGRTEGDRWLQHERLGYNYRISDINCALGIAQLERFDEIFTQRKKVAELYNERLREIDGIIIPQIEANKKISWFVYVIRLTNEYTRENRDFILKKLKVRGIACSNYFSPIHLQPFYKDMFGYEMGDFPVTERISERTVALPFYNKLTEEQVDFICENLNGIIRSV